MSKFKRNRNYALNLYYIYHDQENQRFEIYQDGCPPFIKRRAKAVTHSLREAEFLRRQLSVQQYGRPGRVNV